MINVLYNSFASQNIWSCDNIFIVTTANLELQAHL
jgi:hypothetical protein